MTLYTKINNGTVENIIEADAASAAKHGYIEAPEGVGIGWRYDGQYFTRPAPREMTAAEKRHLVDKERERRLVDGTSFTVAGVTDPIPLQGRPFDQTVYLALLIRANGYKSAGVATAVLKIRDAADTVHMLTPDQMISLISQAMTWFEGVMATSWAMKDGTGDFTDGIPDDFADDTHWP
jgi:hypothetical protein